MHPKHKCTDAKQHRQGTHQACEYMRSLRSSFLARLTSCQALSSLCQKPCKLPQSLPSKRASPAMLDSLKRSLQCAWCAATNSSAWHAHQSLHACRVMSAVAFLRMHLPAVSPSASELLPWASASSRALVASGQAPWAGVPPGSPEGQRVETGIFPPWVHEPSPPSATPSA